MSGARKKGAVKTRKICGTVIKWKREGYDFVIAEIGGSTFRVSVKSAGFARRLDKMMCTEPFQLDANPRAFIIRCARMVEAAERVAARRQGIAQWD